MDQLNSQPNKVLNNKQISKNNNFTSKKEIWAFGGGKGGVGKSVICSNIGIYLTQRGYKVLLVDADFGAANLHTYLGVSGISSGLSDFLLSSGTNINQVIESTIYPNLFLIAGGEDPLKVSNPRFFQVNKLINNLYQLDYDYILIDSGAGTTSQVIDLFTGGTKLILVCTPEPASIENTYRFIKYSFYRGFKKIISNRQIQFFIEKILTRKQTDLIFDMNKLTTQIKYIDQSVADELNKYIDNFNPNLIMNIVQNNNDIKLGFAMTNSCQKYLGINIDYTGFIEYDNNLSSSVKSRTPIINLEPFSKSSRGFKKIGDCLLNKVRY